MNYRNSIALMMILFARADVESGGKKREIQKAIFSGDISQFENDEDLFRFRYKGGHAFHVAAENNISDTNVLDQLKTSYYALKRAKILNDENDRGASSEEALRLKVHVGLQNFLARADSNGYSVLAAAISSGTPQTVSWVMDEMFGSKGIVEPKIAKVGNQNILHLLASRNNNEVTTIFFQKMKKKKVLTTLLSTPTGYNQDETPRYIAAYNKNTLFLQLTDSYKKCDSIDITDHYNMPRN